MQLGPNSSEHLSISTNQLNENLKSKSIDNDLGNSLINE